MYNSICGCGCDCGCGYECGCEYTEYDNSYAFDD